MKRLRAFLLIAVTILVLALSMPMTNGYAQMTPPPPPLPEGGIIAANLNGIAENPLVFSLGSGRFEATITRDAQGNVTSADWTLTYSNLVMVAAAHIHVGKAWENGGVAVALCAPCPEPPAGMEATVMGTIVPGDVQAAGVPPMPGEMPTSTIPAGDLNALGLVAGAGAAYINVHTMAHPGGELRGQLSVEVPETEMPAPPQ